MSRSSRFFRQVWRVNALLILVAAAAATFGIGTLIWSQVEQNMRRDSAAAVAAVVPGKQTTSELHLGNLRPIEGTTLYRAELSTPDHGGSSFSSDGYSSETRNILVVDSATATSHWLLPTDKELIVYNQDIAKHETGETPAERLAATVVLVKANSSNHEAEEGRILIADPAATDVRELISGVRVVHGISLTNTGQIAIMFEQKRSFHLALVDAGNRHLLSDRVVAVPALK
jgi:hypothetical protein